jgi:hypothetical protein
LDSVQVRSKLWLIAQLGRVADLAGSRLLVVGAWYGVLPLLINLTVDRPPASMTCVDIDPGPCRVGEAVIGAMYRNVEFLCADAMELDYSAWAQDPGSVVVNTICEHLPDVAEWWEKLSPGQVAVVQSNNHRGCPDHVSPVESIDQLERLAPMSEVWFEGVLRLSIFDRFMVIGRR